MYSISTAFIKAQMPSVTLQQLANLYKRELGIQRVNNISTNADTISFANDTFKINLDKYSNKFSSFSNGVFQITETETEFVIYFEASLKKLFANAGIAAGGITLFSLFGTGFNFFPLLIGLAVFFLLIIIGYISAYISFPAYFTSLRNDIERELQSRL